jgi:hypothetical protein
MHKLLDNIKNIWIKSGVIKGTKPAYSDEHKYLIEDTG